MRRKEAWLRSEMLAFLKFADDVALMAETEKDLQSMLNSLQFWCECWP